MNWRKPNTTKDFLSGYFYYQLCDWNVCPRYIQKFDINQIKDNDTIFLNLDYFESFLQYLSSINFSKKIILVTQNSDRDFTEEMFHSIKSFTSKILAINCTFVDSHVTKIPLGFNDHSTEVLENEDFTFNEKQNLIYMNFKLHHHSDRPVCFDYFKNFDWVDVEKEIIPLKDFYNKLRTFKYCISPRGTGIDTHRTYESLLYGVIPIVKKSSIDDLYQNFPVVLVNEWSEVTHEFLTQNYEQHLSKYFDWYNNNPDWFKSTNWIKK